MNLIQATAFKQNMIDLSNWVDSTPVPQVIDTFTYDLYESNNPFRHKFSKEQISSKPLRIVANTTTAMGAEVFSVLTNPYYITHKIVNIPTAYHTVVDTYKHYSINKQ